MNSKKITKIFLLVALFVALGLSQVNAATAYDVTFDSNYYANKYADLKAAMGTNEAALKSHFYNYGIKEGRVASPYFDVKYYVESNPDLKAAFGTDYNAAYYHFINYGIKEPRATSEVFNVKEYMDLNKDLKAAFGTDYLSAYNHYMNYGIKEGRKATHSWVVKSETAATCIAEGEKVFYCADKGCTATKTEKLEKVAHNFDTEKGAAETLTDSTCTKEGKSIIRCAQVGCTEVKISVVPAKGHNFDLEKGATKDGSNSVAATCTTEGKDVIKCERYASCQETKTVVVPAKGHNFDTKKGATVTSTTPATCAKEGSKVIKCASCAETKTEVLPKLTTHEKSSTLSTVASTCDYDGEVKYNCAVCGTVWSEVIPAHKFVADGTHGSVAVTCKTDGKKVCTACGKEEVVPATGHNYKIAANFTDEEKTLVETTWGKTLADYKAATCAAAGKEICVNCKDEKTLEKLTHNYVTDASLIPDGVELSTGTKADIKDAVCTKTNTLTNGKKACTLCGDVQDVTAAHDMKITKNETCTEDGVEKCTKCGYTTSRTKTGHNLLEIITKPATSTSVGYKDVYCQNAGCDYSKKNVIIPMTAE